MRTISKGRGLILAVLAVALVPASASAALTPAAAPIAPNTAVG